MKALNQKLIVLIGGIVAVAGFARAQPFLVVGTGSPDIDVPAVFQPSVATVFLDAGATNTVIVGASTSLEDHGTGTVVIPMP